MCTELCVAGWQSKMREMRAISRSQNARELVIGSLDYI